MPNVIGRRTDVGAATVEVPLMVGDELANANARVVVVGMVITFVPDVVVVPDVDEFVTVFVNNEVAATAPPIVKVVITAKSATDLRALIGRTF